MSRSSEGLNTIELDCLAQKALPTRVRYLGALPADKLPSAEHLRRFSATAVCLIANTDPSDRPGQHWVAYYLAPGGELEFFDSFGNDPCAL
jgi:hypothetical protein